MTTVASGDTVPGELLQRIADAAEATGLDEEQPRDVAQVLVGGPDAAPAALRLAKGLQRVAAEADDSAAQGA